jgi:hypothetical protein
MAITHKKIWNLLGEFHISAAMPRKSSGITEHDDEITPRRAGCSKLMNILEKFALLNLQQAK